MKRSGFTEDRIIGVLRQQEAEAGTGEVCRWQLISQATFYKWKAKFGRLDVFDARLKALSRRTPSSRSFSPRRCSNWSSSLASGRL